VKYSQVFSQSSSVPHWPGRQNSSEDRRAGGLRFWLSNQLRYRHLDGHPAHVSARLDAGGVGGLDSGDTGRGRHAQELGFSLTEVKELLALRQKHHACSDAQSMLKRKLADVHEKIKSLERLEAELAGALRNWQSRAALKTGNPP